jgi:hypothetical protein
VLRVTVHGLSPATAHELTGTLSDITYRLPPGRRALMLSVLGGEARVRLVGRESLGLTAGVRGQLAQRRFTLESPVSHQGGHAVTSYGAGFGASLAAEKRIGARTFITAGAGHDRFSFRGYDEIERSYNRTAARWTGTGVRLGLMYDFGRK